MRGIALGCAAVLVALCVAARSPDAAPAPTPAARAARFAHDLSTAFGAHDVERIAALFTGDATWWVVGAGRERRGRSAIEAGLRETFHRYRGVELAIGRIWAGPTASVIEVIFSGTRRAGRMRRHPIAVSPVGAVGAVVVRFDETGQVRSMRLYIDGATFMGQIAPKLLPAGMKVRPPATAPPAGTKVLESIGTTVEAKNLAITNQIWSRLDAHRAADVMASASERYVYEDFAAPGPLDRAGTQKMVAGFLEAIPDFKITARPVQLAAGDEVVTEMVERGTFKGKAVALHGLDVKRFENGRVVEEWQYSSYLEILTQLLGMKNVGSDSAALAP